MALTSSKMLQLNFTNIVFKKSIFDLNVAKNTYQTHTLNRIMFLHSKKTTLLVYTCGDSEFP
ncbi:hypothetical protein Hanom_Chr08g00716401 [Helianthus anomalus]